MYYISTNSLQHHGILGQKWGKRNGPPYPLGYEKHSVVEKRLNKKSTLSPDKGENQSKKQAQYASKKQLNAVQRNARNAANANFKETISNIVNSKEFKIGMAVTASVIIAYGAYKLYGSTNITNKSLKMLSDVHGNTNAPRIADLKFDDAFKPFEMPESFEFYRDLVDQAEDFYGKLPEKYFSLDSIPKIASDSIKNFFDTAGDSAEKALLSGINHGANIYTDNNRNMNCGMCSLSIIARLKGLNVTAAELPNFDGLPRETLEKCFNGGKFLKATTGNKDALVNALISKGNGSYGIMFIPFKTGGAHFISYAVKNGGLELLDGQLESSWKIDDLFGRSIANNIFVMDCTKLELTERALHAFM